MAAPAVTGSQAAVLPRSLDGEIVVRPCRNPLERSRSFSLTSRARRDCSKGWGRSSTRRCSSSTGGCCERHSPGTRGTRSEPRETRSSSPSKAPVTPSRRLPTASGRWRRRSGPTESCYGCGWACTPASHCRTGRTTSASTYTAPPGSCPRAMGDRSWSRQLRGRSSTASSASWASTG